MSALSSNKVFSIVIPVFHNEANLDETLPKLLALKEKLPLYDLELVLVDDGSKDRSYQILTDWKKRFPKELTIVKLTRNFGQNPAILAGLRHARGNCIGIISADLQEPHETFLKMIALWEQGAKYVMGVREGRKDGLSPGSWLYWRLVHLFFSRDFPKQGYDFCLLDKSVLGELNRINERNTSVFTLLFWLGYQPQMIPIVRSKRIRGKSKNHFGKRLRIAIDTFIGFTHLPVRILTATSLILGLTALLHLAFLLTRYLVIGAGPEGWMTIVSLLLIIGSFVLFGLGIAGEYLWRILDEVRGRPSFVVDSVFPSKEI